MTCSNLLVIAFPLSALCSSHIDTMNPYLLSLGAGAAIGIVYALFKVRSPAPPGIALIGLLGMVLGEPLLPMIRHWLGA